MFQYTQIDSMNIVSVQIKTLKKNILLMYFMNLVVNYLDRKYEVLINIFFFENLTRGTSYLKLQVNASD